MLAVFNALIPVFLLIALGFVLKRYLLKDDAHWTGMEQLTYFVLFPALLTMTIARANLASVPYGEVAAALILAILLMSAFLLLLRPLFTRNGISGPTFSSIFQASTRWQTYIALAVAGSLYGNLGLALAGVAMIAMIPLLNVLSVAVLAWFASPKRMSWPQILGVIARNPFIWACLLGLILNLLKVPIPQAITETADALGRGSLAIGLLVVGAGLHLEGLVRPRPAVLLTLLLKLVVMPAMAIGIAMAFGLSGINLAVVACCASVPAASNAYVLARQLGGDAPILAQIIALQTIVAAITMPIAIGFAGPP
ncbi:MAG: transporter [Proteobacteria bacterium SG_bin9]|nr:MAG: transporter [Proteobacteria bacterium SG_bin9]